MSKKLYTKEEVKEYMSVAVAHYNIKAVKTVLTGGVFIMSTMCVIRQIKKIIKTQRKES